MGKMSSWPRPSGYCKTKKTTFVLSEWLFESPGLAQLHLVATGLLGGVHGVIGPGDQIN